jgi:hypothetical protein
MNFVANNSSEIDLLFLNESTNELSYFASIIQGYFESNYFYLTIGIIWPLLVVLGLIGNGLVIFISLSYKKLNDITNFYIFNLAITDLLFALFCIPFTTYLYIAEDWMLGVVFCKLNHFMSHVNILTL